MTNSRKINKNHLKCSNETAYAYNNRKIVAIIEKKKKKREHIFFY